MCVGRIIAKSTTLPIACRYLKEPGFYYASRAPYLQMPCNCSSIEANARINDGVEYIAQQSGDDNENSGDKQNSHHNRPIVTT